MRTAVVVGGLVLAVLLPSAVAVGQRPSVVWYGLRPPNVDRGLRTEIPLSQWEIADAYDTAEQCRKAAPRNPEGWWSMVEQEQRELEVAETQVTTLREALAATPEGRQLAAQWERWRVATRQQRERATPLPPDESQAEKAAIGELLREFWRLQRQWPAAAKAPPDVFHAEDVARIPAKMIGMSLYLNTWKCLPAEALPPGMLPLKK